MKASNLTELIRYRRTVAPKNYTEENPDHDLVEECIDLARNAPNHHLSLIHI